MFELHGVSAGYRDGNVLFDVDLAVPDGTTVALLGPNGAGKTTLLRVAAGLSAPAGSVEFDGVDITGLDPDAGAGRPVPRAGRPGRVPVAHGGREPAPAAAPGRQTGVEPALEAFPMLRRPAAISRPGRCRGGEQQMLALARAFLARPRLVLVDEASMGLAPKVGRRDLRRSSADWPPAGIALLVVEQYVTRALDLADYVYLLNNGRVTFVGEPSELDSDEVFARYVGSPL